MPTSKEKKILGAALVGGIALSAAGSGGGNGDTNQAPDAQITVDAEELLITANASASTDPDGSIVRYTWEIMTPDGAWTSLFATGPELEYEAGTTGIHRVRVTVEDDAGATDQAESTIGVAGVQPPNINLTVTSTDTTISYDVSGSTDPDGTIESWEFVLESYDGSQRTIGTSGTSGTVTVDTEGVYTIYATATDNNGNTATAQESVTIRLPNSAPSASLALTSDHLTINVDASGSTDPDGDSLSYSYRVEDSFGNTRSLAINGPTGSFTVDDEGSYTVTCTVMDPAGATDQAVKSITVRQPNSAPTAEICGYQIDFDRYSDGSIQWWVEVDGSCSTDPNNDITDYRFELVKNGFVVDDTEGPNATNILWLDENGDYTVFLTVTDEHGAGDSDSVSFSFNGY